MNNSNQGNNRQPLRQEPLDGPPTWATVASSRAKVNNKKKPNQQKHDSGKHQLNQDPGGEGTFASPPESGFTKAVKEAERSILIFNLNLGNGPTMNPVTISGKVTVSMLNILTAKAERQPGCHTQEARDLVEDILSQVTKMEFFGTKTSPCKFPNDPSKNGKFYTIPVKLSFKDRKCAQAAAELLRENLGLYSVTPYHKTLRAAINLVINNAKKENPGYQVKANLDLNGKSLKVFVRADTKPPGRWTPIGANVPLPDEALDPTSKDTTNLALPISPSKLRFAENGGENRWWQGFTGQGSNSSVNTTSGQQATNPGTKNGTENEEMEVNVIPVQSDEANVVGTPLLESIGSPKSGEKEREEHSAFRPTRKSLLRSPPHGKKALSSSFGS
jgi:hypothetical protein